MDQLFLDIRYSFRGLLKDPTFTLVALLTLALGIGANTAMFSIIDSVLLQPLSLHHPEDIVTIWGGSQRSGLALSPVAYLDLRDWRDQAGSFEALAGTRFTDGSLRTASGPERVSALRATSGIFTVLGIQPVLGRVFDAGAEVPGHDNVAVITESTWRTRFGARADILGQNIVIDDNAYQVVGVLPLQSMPEEALSTSGLPEVVVPFVPTTAEQNRGLQVMRVLGRIKHGVSVDTATAEINAVNARVEAANPIFHKGWTITVTPLKEAIVGRTRPAMLVLLCAVGCVLLMACVNIANLLLARTVNRTGEFAIRSALGATSARLTRQLATESLLVSGIGGVLGLLLAFATENAVARAVKTFLPRAGGIHVNGRVLLFTFAVSIIAGLAFGLTPAVHARRSALADSLRLRASSSTRTATWMLRGLVVSQTALALVLLVTAGFMIQSFRRLSSTSPGFVADRIVGTQIDLALNRYRKPEDHARFYRQALEKVRAAAGVESAAAVSRLPMIGGAQATSYQTEEHPVPPQDRPMADTRIASPGYFSTMQIPLLFGRDFNDGDRSDTPLVIVVNREAAESWWPGESAIGKRIQIYPEKTFRSVIGVVGGVKLQRLDAEAVPTLYVPYEQNPFPGAARSSFILMRTSMNPETSYGVLKRALVSVDDGQAIGPLQVLSQAVWNSVSLRRFTTILVTAFAFAAAVLSLVGTYGVMSFAVSVRRQDLGIRAALGATRSTLLWWVLRQGVALAVIGIGLGVALAAAGTKLMNQVIYNVRVDDPSVYAGIACALVAACAVACYFPARRAADVDPAIAMRLE